jgi:hypothetical protein
MNDQMTNQAPNRTQFAAALASAIVNGGDVTYDYSNNHFTSGGVDTYNFAAQFTVIEDAQDAYWASMSLNEIDSDDPEVQEAQLAQDWDCDSELWQDVLRDIEEHRSEYEAEIETVE